MALGGEAGVKREGAAVAAVIVAALALSSLPYVVAVLVEPPDRQFMGIVSSVPDWSQYLAWMRGFAGDLVIENMLTCEPQTPAFFNLQWLVLGRLANLLPAAAVLQGFRLLTAAFFLWLTYRVCREYFRAAGAAPAWLAWLLINFSAGLGWLWVLEKHASGLTDARFPMDIYIYEPVSFQGMTIFPHFLLAAALLLLVFRFAVRAIEERRRDLACVAAALALVLGLTHAYDLIVVYGVLGVFAVCLLWRDGFSWWPVAVVGLIGVVSAPPPAYFVYLTMSDPLWRVVLAQFADAGVFTPNPMHLLVLVGLPLLLVLATARNVFPHRWPEPWPLLVRVWAVVNVPLLYIPADYQVHMLSGWQIPLGLLASEGVFLYLVPRLERRGMVRARLGVVALLVLLAVPTNLYLLAWRVREVLKLEHTHFLYRDEIEALSWLGRNSSDGDVVFGSLAVSEYVPYLTGNRVYLGHWAQTVGYREKRDAVARFYAESTSDEERQRILGPCRVRYVLDGRGERALGDFDPSRAPYLRLVHESGQTRIYRVGELPSAAEEAAAEAPAGGSPSGASWSAPLWLSRDHRSAWFPAIAADPAGGVHVFWHTFAAGADLVVHCVVGETGCSLRENAAVRPGADGSYVTRPSAAVDARGMLHLIWRSKGDIAYTRLFLPEPSEGWSPPLRLGAGTYTAIAVDAKGVLHVAWSEPRHRVRDTACNGCADVAYTRSVDGGETWSKSRYVAETPTGSEKPSFAVGHGAAIFLAWEEGRDFYAGKGEPAPSMFAASMDGGVEWREAQQLSPQDMPVQPALGVAGDGTLVVVWRPLEREGVFFQTSSDAGATWSEPQRITGLLSRFAAPDELDDLDVATDSAGTVHLVAAGRTAKDSHENAIFHVAWNGSEWSRPETIFTSSGAPEWPRIAVSEGNRLNVVWFEREEGKVWDSEKGEYRVWFSRSRSDAPAVAPAVWPAVSSPWMRAATLARLAQLAAAIAIVAGVILWARRRGL